MKNPPHPGLTVRHDCLGPLGLAVTEAATRLGVSRKQLSDIVNARAGISAEIAIRLDKNLPWRRRNLLLPAGRLRHGPSNAPYRRHQGRTDSASALAGDFNPAAG